MATLHEAMERLLQQVGRNMATTEIAAELNKNKWYQKGDGSSLTANQISARVHQYPKLFHREGPTIALVGKGVAKATSVSYTDKQTPQMRTNQIPIGKLEKDLMNTQNFKQAGTIDNSVPDSPGLYSIRIKDGGKLPKQFAKILYRKGDNLLYIGSASKSLQKRLLNQELRAIGHGIFFRTIGAVLGYRPPKDSLGSKNTRNYTFSEADKQKIIEWINKNLLVNWVECTYNLSNIEKIFINTHSPLINWQHNPQKIHILQDLRNECVAIAHNK